MSRILVDQIRSNSASADAMTLDGSGNVTFPANATCSGTATGFGGGQVKQFKHIEVAGNAQTNTTTSYVHYTHLDLSITPTAATSIIVMQLFVRLSNNSTNGNACRGFVGVSLDSGSSYIVQGSPYLYRYDSPGGNDGLYIADTYPLMHSAVAGNTNVRNYKVYHKQLGSGSGQVSTINEDGAEDRSFMFLWEITP